MPGGALQGQRNDEGEHDCHGTQAGAAGPAHMWVLQCHCRERLHTPGSAAGLFLVALPSLRAPAVHVPCVGCSEHV